MAYLSCLYSAESDFKNKNNYTDLHSGNYRKAFLACRKHRIDLNIVVDHDPATFMERLPSFVDQIDDVDHLNLFLTSLGHAIPHQFSVIVPNLLIRRNTQQPEVIANLCDTIRLELEKKDITRFVNSIMTAYVVKTPPDHEAGLRLLLRLRGYSFSFHVSLKPLTTYFPTDRK